VSKKSKSPAPAMKKSASKSPAQDKKSTAKKSPLAAGGYDKQKVNSKR